MVNRITSTLNEDEQEKFYALPEALSILGKKKNILENVTLNFFTDGDDEKVCALTNYLSAQGFDQFRIIGAGRYSLILEPPFSKDEPNPIIVRLSLAEEISDFAKTHESPAILLPIAASEMNFGNKKIRVEVKHKLETDRIYEDQERELELALSESGIKAKDTVDSDNAGRLVIKNKSLVFLLDPGVIESNGRVPATTQGGALSRYLDADGKWMQEIFDARLRPGGLQEISHLSLREQMQTGKVKSGIHVVVA